MSLWPRFQKYFLRYDDLDFSIDISRMRFADDFFEKMQTRIDKAYVDMRERKRPASEEDFFSMINPPGPVAQAAADSRLTFQH